MLEITAAKNTSKASLLQNKAGGQNFPLDHFDLTHNI